VLAYLATKAQFLNDAPNIEDRVKDAVFKHLNLRVSPAEYNSWRNSLGNAMFHVMNTETIPDDAAVAVEYRLNGRKFRIDFMVGGTDPAGNESISIIELKQWTDINFSTLNEHVRTVVGGGVRDEQHPSYQAWSYLSHLKNFNEYAYSNQMNINASAYLHNCQSDEVIRDSRYSEITSRAPVYIKGDIEGLRSHISEVIHTGVGTHLFRDLDAAIIRPSKQLADAVGGMLKGKEEFVLLDDQKTALERIIQATSVAQDGQKQVLIINGGPGTGKSVISINAMARITSDRLNARYVTPNGSPRKVYESKLSGIIPGDTFKHLFTGSGSFWDSEEDAYDALIVDESHRLTMKSGFMKNLGENQIKEIVNAARTSIFFIDEAQKVTWADVGEVDAIKEAAELAGARVQELTLESQFRCGGSDDFLAWLDDALGVRQTNDHYFSTERFDFRIFDSVKELEATIREKNKEANKARMVAGYCWEWDSKNDPEKFDIIIPSENFKMKWNLNATSQTWIIEPNSVNEVGCIHTCQGLEVDYVGVIVGEDLAVIDGELMTQPEKRAKSDKSLKGYKKALKESPIEAELKADEIIRNTYRTLMTRGMKGCYVYFVENSTSEYFKSLVAALQDLPPEYKNALKR
jgi:DUF2075 family protein